jgi:predicted permease
MNWFIELGRRLLLMFRRSQFDRDLEEEMRLHREMREREQIEAGVAPEEARYAARRRFGNEIILREESREMWGWNWLEDTLQDVRYGFRTLVKSPGFTSVAILTLALGIGANVAVFSVVNTILLRPLPFRQPQQLIRVERADGRSGESSLTYSVDAYEEFRQQNRSFQDVTGYYAFSASDNYKLMRQGDPLPVTGISVAGSFFQTLGIQPALGRLFTREECVNGGRPAVLLGHAFWQRQFAANPAIVGQAITLNTQAVTVVGVLPEAFDFGSVFSPGTKVDIYVPAFMDDIRDDGNTLALIGRLRAEVSVPQAQAEANILFPHLHFNVKHPGWSTGVYTAKLTGLKEYVSGKLRRSLIVLWCAVGLILLIVCVNLSNLLLARAAARSKEFALRNALGAGRGRLIRQLLTESLVLSSAGALLGLGFAFAITRYFTQQGSIALPLLSSVRVDIPALTWTLLIAVAAAVVFGLVPGLRLSGAIPQEALKDAGPGMSAGRKHERMRAVLVISQVTLACVLLIGAGLLLRSFLRVLDVDLGFQPSRAAAIKVEYDHAASPAKRSAVFREILRRVEAIPGVEIAGISDNLPLGRNRSWGLGAKGKDDRKGDLPGTFAYMVTPGYFDAMGTHLREGRDFGWQDGPESERVVIINQAAARRLWPGEDPLGRIALVAGIEARVIGVVSDVRESSVEREAGWQMYLPAAQNDTAGAELVVRTKLPPEALAPSVLKTLRTLNPGQPANEFRPLQQIVDHAVSPRRFFVSLVTCFAVLGLLLASLGIYGVISYSVAQRTQEIGIRMALGATTSQVLFGVIAKTLRLALIGIALGTVVSLATAKWIASLLFGTEPPDPATFVGIILLLSTVGFIAGYIPARRATKVDPLVALRHE